jgi:hypothetical protein
VSAAADEAEQLRGLVKQIDDFLVGEPGQAAIRRPLRELAQGILQGGFLPAAQLHFDNRRPIVWPRAVAGRFAHVGQLGFFQQRFCRRA